MNEPLSLNSSVTKPPLVHVAPTPDNVVGDDGYVVSYVYDSRDDSSEVVVLDADRVDEEPVARVRIPVRVPLGFHATWVPGERLPGGSARA